MIQIQPDSSAYDDSHYLLLKDVEGVAEGESVKVNLGETVVVGRSRRCHLSLKRAPRYLLDKDGERASIRESLGFRSTSRRHCRVTYLAPDVAEVENLSANGTLVDGHRVDRVLLRDVRRHAHRIRLGRNGDTLELSCGSVELSRGGSSAGTSGA